MLEGFEYTFFNQNIAEKFIIFLDQQHIDSRLDQEEVISGDITYTVILTSQITDPAVETIEQYYDELLFGEQAALIDGNSESGALADVCGIQIQLKDGDFTTVAIQPDIMNKLLEVLSVDEIQTFISQVAEDIEEPKSGPICRRMS